MELALLSGVRLTENGKRDTFETSVMSKILAAVVAPTILGISLLSACAGPRSADHVRFGIWAARHELWEEAIFRWKKVLNDDPRSAAAHNNLAVAYEKKGLWEEARKEYEAALKIAPDNPWIKLNFKRFEENLELGKSALKDKGQPDEKK